MAVFVGMKMHQHQQGVNTKRAVEMAVLVGMKMLQHQHFSAQQ